MTLITISTAMPLVFTRKLDYARSATVRQHTAACDQCTQVAPCLDIDTSENEYGSVTLCQPCLVALFTAPSIDA